MHTYTHTHTHTHTDTHTYIHIMKKVLICCKECYVRTLLVKRNYSTSLLSKCLEEILHS